LSIASQIDGYKIHPIFQPIEKSVIHEKFNNAHFYKSFLFSNTQAEKSGSPKYYGCTDQKKTRVPCNGFTSVGE
jgi:hypothetical protein